MRGGRRQTYAEGGASKYVKAAHAAEASPTATRYSGHADACTSSISPAARTEPRGYHLPAAPSASTWPVQDSWGECTTADTRLKSWRRNWSGVVARMDEAARRDAGGDQEARVDVV